AAGVQRRRSNLFSLGRLRAGDREWRRAAGSSAPRHHLGRLMVRTDEPMPAYWAVYSIAERDRRWRAVREEAAAAGFDCVFVPLERPTAQSTTALTPRWFASCPMPRSRTRPRSSAGAGT